MCTTTDSSWKRNMMIISGRSHAVLAQKIAGILGCECLLDSTHTYADHEFKIRIQHDLYNRNVILLQSTINPVNNHLMELLLLADTAKRAGCQQITAVIPYFGYSRQDRPADEYGPVAVDLVARLLEASGIDKVVTIDLHSKQSEVFFKIGIENLDTIQLFVNALEPGGDYIVVSPDAGGISRAKMLAKCLATDVAIINKMRDQHGQCYMTEIVGNVYGKDCIMIDDIVDTGGTLCEGAKFLVQKGAKSVRACVTHAVFSGGCLQKISDAAFREFIITDTIVHEKLPFFVKVLSIADVIANALVHNDA